MIAHDATRAFEEAVAKYTGAPYCVALENESHAIFLSLVYDKAKGTTILIPAHTYMSVPCEIIHAGGKVQFVREGDMVNIFKQKDGKLTGAYPLLGTSVWDSALRFSADMYIPKTFMCCSFTGPYKRLKLGKGGCILTDNEHAYKWFKKARFSGRNEKSYHEDHFTMLGWNMYMNPIISNLGLLNMQGFYDINGDKIHFPDITLPYPDLSQFPIYTL